MTIPSVRCFDALFGANYRDNFLIFNCREKCRKVDGRCDKCTPEEGAALGELYMLLASYAQEIGAKISYISLAGTKSQIVENMVMYHLVPEWFEYFLPNGYHISITSYYVPFFLSVEMQVCLVFLLSIFSG